MEFQFFSEFHRLQQLKRLITHKDHPLFKDVSRIRQDVKLREFHHEVVGRLARRMSQITGLSLNITKGDVEPLSVINYGLGGWYEEHFDHRPVPYLREATIMFWVRKFREHNLEQFNFSPNQNSSAR